MSKDRSESNWLRRFYAKLGPGVITGAADDDPSGIATYSIAGAQLGTSLLWTALITWPLMACVQFMCARIGMVTGMGLGDALRRKGPPWLMFIGAVALLGANSINVGSDLGGSWRFLITFFSILMVWIVINGVLLLTHAFDPFPFMLLNLILSCLAAVQSPVIMMSQNRAEARDRLRAENDYKINLKAELEIRHLHEKIDHLLRRQYNRLFEIQQIQIELLEELARKREL
jgi:Mn2+/Fe2+ NRAMP family transporter